MSAILIAAGLTGAWMSATSHGPMHVEPPLPVAALAWAQINCDSGLSARSGTPRIQAEDLMRVAARFDAIRNSEGLPFACRRALSVAAEVAKNGQRGIQSSFFSTLASLR